MLGLTRAEDVPAEIREAEPSTANAFDDDDYSPRRMPTGTKLGLAALGIMLLATGVVAIIVGVNLSGGSSDVDASKGRQAASTSSPSRRVDPSLTSSSASDAGSLAGWFFASCFMYMLASFVYLLFWILTMAWVARDAKNRSIDGGAVWVILVFFLHFIGLLVYVAACPHGMLTTCEWCQNRKLNYARIRSHCGRTST